MYRTSRAAALLIVLFAAPAQAGVVLNEIMYRPYYPLGANWVPGTNGFLRAEDQGEYVEIYNRGSSPVNIGGWALTKGVQFEFPFGTTLPAGGYLVVARDPDYMSNYYGLPAAQVFGPWHGATVNEAVTLSGRDKKVELSDEIGNPVDGVHYFDGKSRWSKWADGRGSSLERIDPMEDGSQEGNWDASDESSKSEWKHYSWTGRYIESEKDFTIILLTRGIVLLDNLSVTDPSNPSAGNYIKNGDFEQPLKAPWTIDGSHIHSGRITYDRKDGEACLKIIATGRGNNRIDCIRYLAPQFPRNKDLLVEFDAKWITGYGILQFSGTWNTFAHSFHIEIPQKLGSPGRENSVHARLPSGNQGPLIQQVRQQPVLPGAGQDVVVTAEVSDPDGVKEVKLRYSVESVIAPANEVLMLDDGKGKDARAKDGVYTAVIPGQAMGQRVLFAIKAYDAPGNAGRFPYDDRTRTHSYLLDPGAADESQLRYAAYIHATLGAQGGVPDYRLVMSQENTQYLLSRHVMNNDLIDGSLIWNESKVFYNVGMRFGNSPWTRTASVGTSYKVKLNRDEVLQGNRKFKLFNQGNQINERADYYLHRSANVPGRDPLPFERETYVRPYLNAQAAGLFEREETPDKDFIRRWYPNDDLGVLYKLDDKFLVNLPAGTRRDNRDAFIQYHGDDPEQYRWWFLPRTRDKYDDFSALIDLAKFFTQAKGDDYNSQICKHINLEEVIRTLAVEINCDDWDTWGTTRGKNSYIYHPPIDGRWNLIPWDKNLTFGNPSSLPLVPPMFPETVKLLSSPPGKRMYTVVLNDMLKRFYRADYLNQYSHAQRKDKGGAPIPGVPSSAGGIASFITSRTGMMRSAVPPKELAFAVTTGAPDGVVNASEASLVIEGDAPLTLWHVTISGSIPTWLDPQGKAPALDFDVNDGSLAWTTTTHWKTAAAVPVVNGINILDLVALDQDAIVIGSAQLVVTYNLNWSAPQVTSVEPSQGSVAGGTPVTIHGSGIHVGARVFFATALAALNSLDEAGGTVSVTSPPGTLGPVDVKVVNLDGQSALLAGGFTYLSTSFNRGDVNSSRTINLTDAILILRYSFGSQALPCLDAADVNDDGTINITDPIVLLNYLFLGGGPPAAPFDPTGATFGPDPTPDALPCSRPKPGWTTGIGSKVDWGSPDWHASDRMLCHGRLKEINCRPHLDHYFGRGVAAVHPERDSRCGLGLGPGPCCRGGPDPRSRGHR